MCHFVIQSLSIVTLEGTFSALRGRVYSSIDATVLRPLFFFLCLVMRVSFVLCVREDTTVDEAQLSLSAS